MILARVTGSVVSTIQHPAVDGRKLLLADRLDEEGQPTGGYLIALDGIGAGMGETVLILDEGNGEPAVITDYEAGEPLFVVVPLNFAGMEAELVQKGDDLALTLGDQTLAVLKGMSDPDDVVLFLSASDVADLTLSPDPVPERCPSAVRYN